jgi:sugar-specific transcriptional regulator TrmB
MERSIPAKQIIAELEDELKPEFVNHYDKISEIIQLVSDMIASSQSEVNILISSEDLFLLDEAKLLEGLQDAVTRNVSLRILIQAKDDLLIRNKIDKILKIDSSLQHKTTGSKPHHIDERQLIFHHD